jgi:hypothetical protein
VYRVEYSGQARAQADSLGPAGRQALADAIEQLRRDPSLGQRPGLSARVPHLPVRRVGLVFYLIRQRRGTILLLDIVWAGP